MGGYEREVRKRRGQEYGRREEERYETGEVRGR